MPKPKLKLNTQQAEALFQLYNDVLLHDKPVQMFDRLLHLHICNIYKKLRNKLENIYTVGSCHITLEPYEALAWHEYWQHRSLPPNYVYEANIINTTVNEFNKLYA